MKIPLAGNNKAMLFIDNADNRLYASYDRGKTFAALGTKGDKGDKGDKGARGESGVFDALTNVADGVIVVADGKGGIKSSGISFASTCPDGRSDNKAPTWNAVRAFIRKHLK